jgi:prepilin-type N-terminal cleavage/methylation domain-containing protein
MNSPRHSYSQSRGFTLVELIVAIAVLSIIVIAAGYIVATASLVTAVNAMKINANTQARMVFDRMANDFSRMVKRNDADVIFWKASGGVDSTGNPLGANDAMYFYTEGASYFDSSTFSTVAGYTTPTPQKNTISLVGYRVNNNPVSSYPSGANPDYYQMERLGKALAWDGASYNASASQQNSLQPNFAVFLTYPPAGSDVINNSLDQTGVSYSTAFFNSTLAGAYSNSGNNGQGPGVLPSAVGTCPAGSTSYSGTGVGFFNDSTDTDYHTVGSQVFRFEFSFQLKDGTQSAIPVMSGSTTSGTNAPNGIPNSFLTAQQRPQPTDDSLGDSSGDIGTNTTAIYGVGSRWYDTTNQIGYICVDATPNYAVWHEIGIQDVAAVVVTIAVISKQGLVYANNVLGAGASGSNTTFWPNLVAVFPDSDSVTPTVTAFAWEQAITPDSTGANIGTSKVSRHSGLPQSMVSQIRIYQRYFYINNL